MGTYLGLPASTGLFVLAAPILYLIFPTLSGGEVLLELLAIALFFITINQVFTGVLQGLDKVTVPVKNIFIGSGVKIVCSYVLTANPLYNIKGAAIGTLAGYLTSSLLNYIVIKKYTHIKFKVGEILIKPLLSSLIMGIVALSLFKHLISLSFNVTLATLLSILVGGITYGVMIFLVGGIHYKEVLSFFKRK